MSPLFFSCVNPVSAEKNVQADNEGLLVYRKFCLSCHQSDGSGVPGMFPPLQNNERVQKDEGRLIKIVIEGMTGEIDVNGDIYNNYMPPMNYLTNEQIADVLSYIRSNFGNEAPPVSPEKVSKFRNSN